MLIPLGGQYVSRAHIVEVVAHPASREVCVVLSNGKEVRLEMDEREDKYAAVARVARLIMSKAGR